MHHRIPRAIHAAYLAALWLLQFALVWRVVPEIARVLPRHVPVGTASDTPVMTMQVMAAAVVVACAALCLAVPAITAARHHRAGRPADARPLSWDRGLALAGAVVFCAGATLALAPDFLGLRATTATLAGLPLVTAGLALMCAGVLAAEFLRMTSVSGDAAVPPPGVPAAGSARAPIGSRWQAGH